MNQSPTKESVGVLTQTILPFSLHGVNPRTIMGEEEWQKVKKETQKQADHHCMCCGRSVQHIPGDWVETHEMYSIDTEKHVFELSGFVGLCNDCHSYIHQGRLRILVAEGKMRMSEYTRIIEHGDKLLDMFGLSKHDLPGSEIENPEWRLLYNGELYKNDYK